VKPTRWQTLVLLALGTAVVAFAGLTVWESMGGGPVPTPWSALVAMVVIAVSVLVVAWPVRRWISGVRDRRLDPLRAARAAVLAKAASHCGALLVGWYLAQALVVVGDLGLLPRRDRFVASGIALVVAVGVVVAGKVGERWCRLPEDPDDPDGLGGPSAAGGIGHDAPGAAA
jgi:hypothetical protein